MELYLDVQLSRVVGFVYSNMRVASSVMLKRGGGRPDRIWVRCTQTLLLKSKKMVLNLFMA